MIANIVNLFTQALATQNVSQNTSLRPVSSNPFASPFVNTQAKSSHVSYAKNKPVSGGYFAGYYNGKANIVGQRLFVEA